MGVSQSNFTKIYKTVLTRFKSYYHYELTAEMQNALCEDLEKYSENNLEEAMVNLRRRSNKTPSVDAIIKECDALIKRDKKISEGIRPAKSGSMHPWEEKRLKVVKMRDNYVNEWSAGNGVIDGMINPRAIEEGWFDEGLKYVKTIAELQANIIYGTHAIGIDYHIIFAHLDGSPDENIMGLFWDDMRAQASNGHVKVDIPEGLILYWIDMNVKRMEYAEKRKYA